MLKYSKFQNADGTANATLFFEGEIYGATSDHPNWDAIVAGLEAGDPNVADLFDMTKVVSKKFEALSERVTVRNGRLHLDGDEVNNVLTKQILRFLDDGQDFAPLVNFYERLTQNPNQESVEQLYRWLSTHDFTITSDGYIVGYKGVEKAPKGGYRSMRTGTAIVNGVEHTGQIPNDIGFVVEMPRSQVTFDPGQGCSVGLHVGTWDYARDWAKSTGVVLKVVVDPRDVVSVPTDSGDAKLRTCRYTVQEVITTPVVTAVDAWDDEDDDNDALDYHDYCACGEACYSCDESCDCEDDL